MNNNENEEKWRFLDYCWRYFELQSRQRNQTCIMYLSLLTASITGFFSALKNDYADWVMYSILGFMIACSVAFLVLFNRTTELRQRARNALNDAEEEIGIPDIFRFFNKQSIYKRLKLTRKPGETDNNFYTKVFEYVSFIFIILPIVIIMLMCSGII